MSILKNLRNRGFKDILNPRRWIMYLRSKKVAVMALFSGKVRALKKEYADVFEDPNLLEQVSLRMVNPGCRSCLKEGECVHCGCISPDLFFEKDMECSGGNWFGMLPSSYWPQYKKEARVRINKDHITQIKKHGKIIEFK